MHGLELGVNRGHDYEIGDILNKHMRHARFTGCSGQISFDQTSNDRTISGFDVSQFRFNEATDAYESKTLGTYNPLASVLFQFEDAQAIVWPDGTTNVPSDSRHKSFDC